MTVNQEDKGVTCLEVQSVPLLRAFR